MSKTKNTVIDDQNKKQQEQPKLAKLLNGDKSVTDIAAVVCGMFFCGTETPPVVYVQSDDRVIVVTATHKDVSLLSEAVAKTFSDKGYTATASPIYGDEITMEKVWQIINVEPKNM